jgi:hypothetical protein
MAVPSSFFGDGSDLKLLEREVHIWGDASDVSEEDLLVALGAVKLWRDRFTEPFTFEFRGEQISWHRYEALIWALGESFRRLMLSAKELRGRERVFEAVRFLCLDKEFGKGRESFTMLLGQYGGRLQIPTLIKLLEDSEVCGPAVYALRLLGAYEAADRIRPFLNSSETWVRKESIKFF